MNVQSAKYRKLPGRNVNFFGGRSQLWIAEDHLLEVTGLMLAERYRRFPLADIRAFVVEKTRSQAIALWIYGGVLAISGSATAALIWGAVKISDRDASVVTGVFAGFAGIVAVIALIGLLITLFRGATCRCSIQTTAGLRVLAAPTRRRGAERLLAVLAPEIEAAQAAPR